MSALYELASVVELAIREILRPDGNVPAMQTFTRHAITSPVKLRNDQLATELKASQLISPIVAAP